MSKKLPSQVIALGFVSLFMDMSSEMIFSVLPIFLVDSLGVSAVALGLLEGVAEAIASFTKVFSGVFSDLFGKRKPLVLIGYGLSAFTKPLFALAGSIGPVAAARFSDRVGKGIRGAPRDALVADVTEPSGRGAAYGFRQAMDSVGAFLGPLAALAVLAVSPANFRAVFWTSLLPAAVCVAVIVFSLKEPAGGKSSLPKKFTIRREEFLSLPSSYWLAVAFSAILTLARFSEAFLILRARDAGLALNLAPVVLIVMNVVYALSSYPLGRMADRLDRRVIMAVGIFFILAADAFLSLAQTPAGVFAGVVLWGLHMGATQGLLMAIVADSSPPTLRGTAFGVFHLSSGAALLLASAIAGALWQSFGPPAAFAAGGVFALLSFLGLLFQKPKSAVM